MREKFPNLETQQNRGNETYWSIEIQGTKDFIARTKYALYLLSRDSKSFLTIKQYLGRVMQAERSGMNVNSEVPTFEVADPSTMSSIWFAGNIAHDTYHSALYHRKKEELNGRRPDRDVWTGAEAEKQCLEFQLQTLRDLTADASLIKYVEQLKSDPTYQNVSYSDRNW